MTNEVKKQPIPTKEECLAFYKELAKLADVRFMPYYNMAIKALKQEPCDDAISRQAGRMKAYTASRKSVKVIDSKPSANKSGSVTKK